MITTIEAVPLSDYSGIQFMETTGRAPLYSDGYGEFLDISSYTGKIQILSNGIVQGELSHPPSDQPNKYRFSWTEFGIDGELADGIYVIEYEVKDENGLKAGSYSVSIIIRKQMLCDVERVINTLVYSNDRKARKDAAQLLTDIDAELIATTHALKQGNVESAEVVFERVITRAANY